MVTTYLCRGRNDLSNISVPAGTPVRIIVPTGYFWRPAADGAIDVLPRWWRRMLDRVLDLTPFHVIAAIAFLYWVIRLGVS